MLAKVGSGGKVEAGTVGGIEAKGLLGSGGATGAGRTGQALGVAVGAGVLKVGAGLLGAAGLGVIVGQG